MVSLDAGNGYNVAVMPETSALRDLFPETGKFEQRKLGFDDGFGTPNLRRELPQS
jgi:hypothetical protein